MTPWAYAAIGAVCACIWACAAAWERVQTKRIAMDDDARKRLHAYQVQELRTRLPDPSTLKPQIEQLAKRVDELEAQVRTELNREALVRRR